MAMKPTRTEPKAVYRFKQSVNWFNPDVDKDEWTQTPGSHLFNGSICVNAHEQIGIWGGVQSIYWTDEPQYLGRETVIAIADFRPTKQIHVNFYKGYTADPKVLPMEESFILDHTGKILSHNGILDTSGDALGVDADARPVRIKNLAQAFAVR